MEDSNPSGNPSISSKSLDPAKSMGSKMGTIETIGIVSSMG